MKKILVILVGLPVVMAVMMTGSVLAINETIENSVVDNCVGIKAQIRRLQISDANSRIALGRSYDRISGELMTNFNTRAEINGQKNEELIRLAREFTRFAQFFRESYRQYDNEIGRVLSIDCVVRPSAFYAGLERLRLLRAGVRGNSDAIIEITNMFREEVETAFGGGDE
ncbi:hypothetical protein FWH09_02965 [Candidatus Saccharibacteria bacterium]|nr:hypothetical protein [Candidatus Saccharibacteria bacterium]